MTKPVVILDPDWRRMDELFSPRTQLALRDNYDVVWGKDGPIPADLLEQALAQADILIAATPHIDAGTLARAPNLCAVIEVSGAFPDTIDYAACFDAGVEVLSCAPGFRQSVAEMGLAMALAGGRGLVAEHEKFRTGQEHWLSDRSKTDFTLFEAQVGFIGFGQIAQELARLLAPFRPSIRAFDPWLPANVAQAHGVDLVPLDEVLKRSRCVFVTASPTSENHHLLNAEKLALLPEKALLVVLSRAHLVDFDALAVALAASHIRACIDVFPSEPVPADDPLRSCPGAILSPHRAAAVEGGRQLIGELILKDLESILADAPHRTLQKANRERISAVAGVGDAQAVSDMAMKR